MSASSLKEATEFKYWDIHKLCPTLTSKTERSLLTHRQLNRLQDSLKMIPEGVPLMCKSWEKERKSQCAFTDGAKVTNIIRSWYEASDAQGISSNQ